MSMQKQIFVVLIVVAIIGTLAKWLLSVHERSLLITETQVKVRIQQIQNECQRQISVHKEEFQKLWDKKLKEMEAKFEKEAVHEKVETDGNSAKALTDKNEKLETELIQLQEKLNEVTKHFNEYKSQMEKIANLVEQSRDNNPDTKVLESEVKTKKIFSVVESPNTINGTT